MRCCALVVPLLPVRQTTSTILWPQGLNADGHVTDITAPLVSGAPRALDISIPCAAIATLPADGGLVVSTLPVNGFETGKNGLFVRANKDTVVVAFRDSVAAAAPRSAVAAGACSVLHIWADAGGAGADFVGIPGATGTLAPEKKPAVGGIFTDLTVAAQPGLSARIDVDTRFIVAPTLLKIGGDGAGRAGRAGLDRRAGRPGPPIGTPDATKLAAPSSARHAKLQAGFATWLADAGVIATLLLWHVIGATSSDDGYNLTMARVAGHAGYVANYYRYFGTSEAPFDWYQSVLAQLAIGEHRRRVDATARHAGRDRHLVDHQPLHAATAGPRPWRPGRQPRGGVDGRRGVPGGLAAVQQRPAARAADRAGRGRSPGCWPRPRSPPAVWYPPRWRSSSRC